MQPCAVRQPSIDIWGRVVEPPACRCRQSLGEASRGRLVGQGDLRPFRPASAIHPNWSGPVHEDVGHVRVGQQRLEYPGPYHLGPECDNQFENGGITEENTLTRQGRSNPRRRRGPAGFRELLPNLLEEAVG